MGDAQPGSAEIEAWFVAVLEGRVGRDEADRWAARWVLAEGLRWGELELWALQLLFGIDLRHGPGADYLHGDEQVREWLEEFRLGLLRRDVGEDLWRMKDVSVSPSGTTAGSTTTP